MFNDDEARHLAHNPEAGDDTLWVKFYVRAVQDRAKSTSEGHPVFVDKEYVEIRMPGVETNIQDRPVTLADRERFAERYRRWKDGEKAATIGMPLKEWPGITRGRVEELANAGIHTVEQLAGIPDVHAQRVGPILELKQRAKDYLTAAKSAAPVSKLRAELEAEKQRNEEERMRREQLEAQLKELSERFERAESARAAEALKLEKPEAVKMARAK